MQAIAVRDRDAGLAGLAVTDLPYPRAAENDAIVRVHTAGFTRGHARARARAHGMEDRRARDQSRPCSGSVTVEGRARGPGLTSGVADPRAVQQPAGPCS